MYRGFIIPLILGFIVIEVVLMIMNQFMAALIISGVVLAAMLSVSFFRRAPPPPQPKLANNQPIDPTLLYYDPRTNRLLSATI